MRPVGTTAALARNFLASVSLVALLVAASGPAAAHTVSIGYTFSGPGAVVV